MDRVREMWKASLAQGRTIYRRALRWIVANVPPGARTLLGLLLMAGGVFGFLPILGFWMIPLGVAVILLDVAVLRRWKHGRPIRWRHRHD